MAGIIDLVGNTPLVEITRLKDGKFLVEFREPAA